MTNSNVYLLLSLSFDMNIPGVIGYPPPPWPSLPQFTTQQPATASKDVVQRFVATFSARMIAKIRSWDYSVHNEKDVLQTSWCIFPFGVGALCSFFGSFWCIAVA